MTCIFALQNVANTMRLVCHLIKLLYFVLQRNRKKQFTSGFEKKSVHTDILKVFSVVITNDLSVSVIIEKKQ
jgi:hypothetical protein